MLANQSGCVCTKRENLAVSSSPLILPKLQLGDQSRNNRRNHFNGFELILTKESPPDSGHSHFGKHSFATEEVFVRRCGFAMEF